jgi:hypothetical protein
MSGRLRRDVIGNRKQAEQGDQLEFFEEFVERHAQANPALAHQYGNFKQAHRAKGYRLRAA